MWRKVLIVALLLSITAVFVAQPAQAQTVVWHGEYFNNSTLSGNPAFTHDDTALSFNWGTGSPGSGIGDDNFSVRWAADVSFSPGTYRFYALADDNIRVIFNFVTYAPVIDTFANNQINQLQTGDVTVTTPGVYHIQVDYREVTDQAFANVSFANIATNPGGPNFPAPVVNVPVATGSWTAQYFANAGLLGDPVAIITENSPSHNWGSGSPMASVPADNFSVRWTSIQNLAGGMYSISAAADDGIRVYVNGNLMINEWHGANGQSYNTSVNLPAGQNYFQVEYYEALGDASISFTLSQLGGGGSVVVPTQPPLPTGASATVTAYRLNVRALPDSVNGQIITRINRLEVYPIVGRTADSAWYLLNINGVNGWVYGPFINVVNGTNIPVVNGQATPVSPGPGNPQGNVVTAQPYNVVIRSGPGTQYRRLGLLPNGASAQFVGRNSSNTWWQINLNGLVGWVSGQYAFPSPTANVNGIPITG
jgi:uncharacterized protein YraI